MSAYGGKADIRRLRRRLQRSHTTETRAKALRNRVAAWTDFEAAVYTTEDAEQAGKLVAAS